MMKKNMLHYWRVWKLTALNALQMTFVNRWTNALFIFGKIIRFSMSLIFLFVLRETTAAFHGYTTDEMIVFFLTYLLVDQISQMLYRGVYMFGNSIRDGSFDFTLAQPISPLFRALSGHPDINDALFLLPSIIVSLAVIFSLNLSISMTSVLWFFIVLLNSMLIVTALHIIVLVIGILTVDVDGIIWFYRDIMQLSRFPVTIYMEPLRFILFFVLPVGMMVTIPAEILVNVPLSHGLLAVFGVGGCSITASALLWRWGLRRYTSASS